jgi:hypothetical protein
VQRDLDELAGPPADQPPPMTGNRRLRIALDSKAAGSALSPVPGPDKAP